MSLDIQQISLLLINGANVSIGVLVFLKNPRRLVNQSFFLFVAGSSAWAMGISLLYITHIFAFDKLALGGGLLMLLGLTLFARVFPSETALPRKFFLVFIPLIIAALCLPFNLFIQSITVDLSGLIKPRNGILFPFFVANTIWYVMLATYYFVRSFQISKRLERMQMLYLITGMSIFIASLTLFDAALPLLGIYRFNLLGPAASCIFVLMAGYAIVRHRLMDIRLVIQRGAIYSLLMSLIIASYIALLLIFHRYVFFSRHIREALSAGIIMLVGIVTVPHIESYFQRVTDRFFFKDRYVYAHVLEILSTVLNENLELAQLIPNLLQTLTKIFKPTTLEFVLSNTDAFPKSSFDKGLLLEIQTHDRRIGAFMFGPKRSGDPYTNEDTMLLRTFATQASVALGKAELYEELQEHTRSLESKVKERTKDIRALQEYQQQLFDDISHALQTPLTVLKSSIELLTPKQQPLGFYSNQPIKRSLDDLSSLIRDLLQLARIDSMPIEEEQEEIDLSTLVAEVCEYVEIICHKPNIKLRKTIAQGIRMRGNPKQIEEVVNNLLSNSIRYTTSCPIREISVELKRTLTHVEITIKDTGIGIPKESIPHIFNRFYRVQDRAGAVGCGLGLAIVQRIVERHHGSVEATSELGQSTTITVRFPQIDS
jgi:signal transduction histidine kinase